MVKLLDANIIIRFVLWPTEPLFEESSQIMTSIELWGIKVIINDVILGEAIYVLVWYYGYARTSVSRLLKDILLMEGVINTDQLILLEALSLYADTKLDYADCLLIAIGKIDNREILTFDSGIQKYISKTKK